jgi:hypothetical protein
MTKCLLDGVIAAFHVHNGSDLETVPVRIGAKLNRPQFKVVEKLMNPVSSPLGARQLLRQFGSGIQWNPADDLCVQATIKISKLQSGV